MPRLKDRPDVEFFALVAAIGRLADRRLERAAADGLSPAGLGVLNRVAHAPAPPGPNDLAQALRLSKPAITHTLQRLEAAGLVALAPDPQDGRRKRVALTAAGLAAHRAALEGLRPPLAALRAAFGPDDFAAALPFLRRLAHWLGQER